MELKDGQIIIDLPRFEDTGAVIKYGETVWSYWHYGRLECNEADNELYVVLYEDAPPHAVLAGFYAPPYFSSKEAALAYKAAAKAEENQ